MVFEAFAGSAAPILAPAVNDLSGYRAVVEPRRLPIIGQSCASLARPSHTGGRINFFRGSGGRFFIKDGDQFRGFRRLRWNSGGMIDLSEALPLAVIGSPLVSNRVGGGDGCFHVGDCRHDSFVGHTSRQHVTERLCDHSGTASGRARMMS